MPGNKPIFNADAAEEYFTMLCTFYRDTANDIFNRDNEGRHASDHVWSAEYQKYIGMQIAMREVLKYFSKFELVTDQEIVTNADRIRAMSDEELALELALIAEWDRKEFAKAKNGPGLVQFMREWLRKSEEVDGT